MGTAELTGTAKTWIENGAQGVLGDAEEPELPGCAADRGSFRRSAFGDSWDAMISQTEMS